MSAAGEQPSIESSRRVLDSVVGLVARRHYRQARMQLAAHERRHGLAEISELVGRITAPPAGVDPRTESQARLNVPSALPVWLATPVQEEVVRICARQSIRLVTVPQLIARILAASIVDESAPGHEDADAFAARAHVDLRDTEPVGEPLPEGTVVDVSDGRGTVRRDPTAEPERRDRSLTDWLGRRS